MLAVVIYFALRTIAIGLTYTIPATLVLIWVYILIAGAPPSAIRTGGITTLMLVARLLGRQVSLLHCMNSRHL